MFAPYTGAKGSTAKLPETLPDISILCSMRYVEIPGFVAVDNVPSLASGN